jgi:hypothetical protein
MRIDRPSTRLAGVVAGIALGMSAACAHPASAPTPASPSLGTSSAAALVTTSAAITARDLESRLTAFAHDTMMGREAGTIWNVKATDYLAAQFQQLGLRPAGENGGYFQTVPNIRPRDPTMPLGPARNVIAVIPGSDPALRGEYVSISGHNDHVGFNHRPVDHDSIRAFDQIIRPLGADSPPHAPSAAGFIAPVAHAAARLDQQRRR